MVRDVIQAVRNECSTSLEQTQGALPYNMTSFQPIRDLLREIGGEEAAKTMPTPTFSVCVNDKGQMFVRVTAGEVIARIAPGSCRRRCRHGTTKQM